MRAQVLPRRLLRHSRHARHPLHHIPHTRDRPGRGARGHRRHSDGAALGVGAAVDGVAHGHHGGRQLRVRGAADEGVPRGNDVRRRRLQVQGEVRDLQRLRQDLEVVDDVLLVLLQDLAGDHAGIARDVVQRVALLVEAAQLPLDGAEVRDLRRPLRDGDYRRLRLGANPAAVRSALLLLRRHLQLGVRRAGGLHAVRRLGLRRRYAHRVEVLWYLLVHGIHGHHARQVVKAVEHAIILRPRHPPAAELLWAEIATDLRRRLVGHVGNGEFGQRIGESPAARAAARVPLAAHRDGKGVQRADVCDVRVILGVRPDLDEETLPLVVLRDLVDAHERRPDALGHIHAQATVVRAAAALSRLVLGGIRIVQHEHALGAHEENLLGRHRLAGLVLELDLALHLAVRDEVAPLVAQGEADLDDVALAALVLEPNLRNIRQLRRDLQPRAHDVDGRGHPGRDAGHVLAAGLGADDDAVGARHRRVAGGLGDAEHEAAGAVAVEQLLPLVDVEVARLVQVHAVRPLLHELHEDADILVVLLRARHIHELQAHLLRLVHEGPLLHDLRLPEPKHGFLRAPQVRGARGDMARAAAPLAELLPLRRRTRHDGWVSLSTASRGRQAGACPRSVAPRLLLPAAPALPKRAPLLFSLLTRRAQMRSPLARARPLRRLKPEQCLKRRGGAKE
mmetsp:Transcript_14796/g.44571  ORF Transcript_14796/g.44571 Transcript_14796/m.44571 type:complete len:678 (+) Transcript_14796:1315-3348(+)